MRAGGKYLLLLYGGTHGLLAGDSFVEPGEAVAQANDADGGPGPGPQPGTRQRGQRGGGGAQQGLGQRQGAGDRRSPRPVRAFEVEHIAAVRGVTTAFLDATVKDDAAAREWLAKEAARWLGRAASLQSK